MLYVGQLDLFYVCMCTLPFFHTQEKVFFSLVKSFILYIGAKLIAHPISSIPPYI